MKCGYVAVLGLPNAGKSSLVNFLVGEEVAVVSHRRQTTRNSILGIKNGTCNGEEFQMVFIDTPGIHHSKNSLDRFMMKNVRGALATADVVLYLFDGSKQVEEEEAQYIRKLVQEVENLILVKTKSDKNQVAQPKLDEIFLGTNGEKQTENVKRKVFEKPEIIKISAISGENINFLCEKIEKMLPNAEKMFENDEYTDKSVSFLICEKIRGTLLDKIDNEIPHGVAVVITNFEEKENFVNIGVEIICEKQQHKGIIIGKNGKTLKEIGIIARKYAEELLAKKVLLKIFVKVDQSWRDKNIIDYGYKI